MGNSGKPDIAYTLTDHAQYLDAWFAAMDLSDIALVVHDWESALGIHPARRRPAIGQAVRDRRRICLAR
ncbi:MAG TPA: hypothetical protein VHV82_18170 [Sporichthyaceae bacterium]|jgi:haloalkane dehalogenase|nr:hypothetical protein [Sporichthyaceae bacterium]